MMRRGAAPSGGWCGGKAITRVLLLALLLTGLAACADSSYQSPAFSLDPCFLEPWRPNC